MIACCPTGYEPPVSDEYLVVDKQILEDRLGLLRANNAMLREELKHAMWHVTNLRVIDRIERVLAITAPRRR